MKKHLLFMFSMVLLFCTTISLAGNLPSGIVCTWLGQNDSNWNNAENWSTGTVPFPYDDVVIPGNTPYDPVLDNANKVVCSTMTLESSKLKESGSSRSGLIISGGEVVIDGNLTIKANAVVTIDIDGALTVNGNVNIVASGGMVLESGGSLITNGTITGTGIVKRIIQNDLTWHFLSSPVNYQLICNGIFAPTPANFATTPVTSWDFYTWLPNCPVPPEPAEHWRNLRNDDLTINTADFGTVPAFEVTKGYLVSYKLGFATTKVFTGNPNTGDKVFSYPDVITGCSWVLAGNPYPSAFDWNKVLNKTNLSSGYYYVWNDAKSEGAGGYEAYLDNTFKTAGVDGNIPSMQGFFVKIDPAKAREFDVPNSARVHDLDLWLKNSDNIIQNRLTITIGNGVNSDDAIIQFGPGCATGADWYDAEKMFSPNVAIPQVYTIVDNNIKTVINGLPYLDNSFPVPVGFVAPAAGEYTLSFSGLESFRALTSLVLEDLTTNTTQNLYLNKNYHFYSEGIEDAGRFILHFAGAVGLNEKDNSTVRIYSSEKTIFIGSAEGFHNSRMVVSNTLGQEILSSDLADQAMNQFTVNAPAGYYIVTVRSDRAIRTQKVFIQ